MEQTLFNWVEANRQGGLKGADSEFVCAEQMERGRLRAELARVKMERDTLGNATAYFAKAKSRSTPSSTVIDALRTAWFKRHPSIQVGLIFHSDKGSCYASQDFRNALTEYGCTASMSRRGNCWDNAGSETLFGSLGAERLHGQCLVTRRQAKNEVVAWLLWYDQTRLHVPLIYASPIRFEQDWLAAQAMQVNS